VDTATEIDHLRVLSRPQLQVLWQKLYGRAVPRGVRREVMIPFLAYKIQEREYGGLKSSMCAELRRIARGLEGPLGTAEPRSQRRIKTGTRLIRQWRGERHEVAVNEIGFEYRGTKYRSLSEIARKITGTRWSGPAFFGLNDVKSIRHHSND
jgi:hypothetical protein